MQRSLKRPYYGAYIKQVLYFLLVNMPRILWVIFTSLMILILIKVYHNKKNFDPIDFVEKNCTVIDVQDFSERPDLEGELIAVSGMVTTHRPVRDDGFFPGYNFIVLARLRQEDSKKSIRPNWNTVEYSVQTCGTADIGAYNFSPDDILFFHNAPFGIQMDIDRVNRLVFYGVPSPSQGIILGTINKNQLVPYQVKPHRSWIANLFCSEPNKAYTFFYYGEGTFNDLMVSLRKQHLEDLADRDYTLAYLCFVLGVPYTMALRRLWPSFAPRSLFRLWMWIVGLVMLSQLVLEIFKAMVHFL